MDMHPRIREVIDCLDQRRDELRQAIEAVPAGMRNTRPAPDRWSSAEIIDHLAMVEERVMQLAGRQLADARANGLGPERETTPVLPTMDWHVIADRSRPRQASDAVAPRPGVNSDVAWTRLERARETTRELLRTADGLALAEVVAPNPVLGPLNLYQWVLFIAGHEARHTDQIRELTGPGTGASPAV